MYVHFILILKCQNNIFVLTNAPSNSTCVVIPKECKLPFVRGDMDGELLCSPLVCLFALLKWQNIQNLLLSTLLYENYIG